MNGLDVTVVLHINGQPFPVGTLAIGHLDEYRAEVLIADEMRRAANAIETHWREKDPEA